MSTPPILMGSLPEASPPKTYSPVNGKLLFYCESLILLLVNDVVIVACDIPNVHDCAYTYLSVIGNLSITDQSVIITALLNSNVFVLTKHNTLCMYSVMLGNF